MFVGLYFFPKRIGKSQESFGQKSKELPCISLAFTAACEQEGSKVRGEVGALPQKLSQQSSWEKLPKVLGVRKCQSWGVLLSMDPIYTPVTKFMSKCLASCNYPRHFKSGTSPTLRRMLTLSQRSSRVPHRGGERVVYTFGSLLSQAKKLHTLLPHLWSTGSWTLMIL